MQPDEIIELLDMKPHPEGGYFAETWRATGPGRAAGTCIYFLLMAGQKSHWHRVDAAEIWHFYAGDPLCLSLSESASGPKQDLVLGTDLATAARPQIIVPPGFWQMAEPLGAWTLVGCTVSPGFEFEHFELAAPDFDIPAQASGD